MSSWNSSSADRLRQMSPITTSAKTPWLSSNVGDCQQAITCVSLSRNLEALAAPGSVARLFRNLGLPKTCEIPKPNEVNCPGYELDWSTGADQVERKGIERPPNSSIKTPVSSEGGAKCGALIADFATSDTKLSRVVEAQSNLPAPIKAGIMAMIQAAGGVA